MPAWILLLIFAPFIALAAAVAVASIRGVALRRAQERAMQGRDAGVEPHRATGVDQHDS